MRSSVSDEEIHGPGTALPIVPVRPEGHVFCGRGGIAEAYLGMR